MNIFQPLLESSKKITIIRTINSRFTSKIVAALVGAALLAVGGGVVISFSILDETFRRESERSTTNLLAFLSTQMYYSDVSSTDLTLKILKNNNIFARLELYDRYGSVINEVGKPISKNFLYKKSDVLSTDGVYLGELRVWYNAKALFSTIKTTLVLSLTVLIMSILIFGGLLINKALNQEVITPLNQLRRKFSDSSSMDLKLDFKSLEFRELALTFSHLTRNLTELATIDELTGLYNRRQILVLLKKELILAKNNNTNVRIYYLDLDNFKRINDHFGHSIGDALLRKISHEFKKKISSDIHLARLGGDEFLAIEKNATNHNTVFIDAVFSTFLHPLVVDGKYISAFCSIGSAIFPKDGQSVEDLLKHSDLALYQAKAGGRRRFVEYNEQHRLENSTWIENEAAVRTALLGGSNIFYFQSIISVDNTSNSNIYWGAEALLRVKNKQGKLINPVEAIKLSEELGMLEALTLITIDQAVYFLQNKDSPKQVSVNFSRNQILRTNISCYAKEKLRAQNIPRSSLIIEVTEDGLLDDEEIITALNTLSENGFRIALDDFGSGHSALACIKKLPLDFIKLDKSLLRECNNSQTSSALFCAIVSIAQKFDCKVIAEGVESKNDLAMVIDCACDFAQGYFFDDNEYLHKSDSLAGYYSPTPVEVSRHTYPVIEHI